MKPRTKLQRQVIAMSQCLSPITENQKKWAFFHCFNHYGRRTKKGAAACLECGYTWNDKFLKPGASVCPHCGCKIEIIETRKRRFKRDETYFCVLTTFRGYQVIRYFDLYVTRRVGREAWYGCMEVVQLWITPEGKYIPIARLRPLFACYTDSWNWNTDMEVRSVNSCYNINPNFVYPWMRVIPALKRNGFRGELYGCSPLRLFQTLLTNNRAETLLKAGQYPMFCHEVKSGVCSDSKYWPSVRICIRNGYRISDGALWCDYIDLLRYFNKDLFAAKYVCPVDLKVAHDHLERKKRERLAKEEFERMKGQVRRAEHEFRQQKSKFFGIRFSAGKIHVRVLESVEEYFEEGAMLHHCVFTQGYYKKSDTLLLSASVGQMRMETIEISLKTFQIIQCRGAYNLPTAYHDEIVRLVERNMHLIRKRMTA